SFHGQAAEDVADAAGKAQALVVAVLHTDVQHGGGAAAVFCRKAALDKVKAFHRIRVEYGEEAQHVGGVVQGSFIQQDEVLIGGAAAHVKPVSAFSHGGYAGQRLYGAQHIHFAHEGRQFLHLRNIQAVDAGAQG